MSAEPIEEGLGDALRDHFSGLRVFLQEVCLDGGHVHSKIFPGLGKMAGHATEKKAMVFCVGSDEDVNR